MITSFKKYIAASGTTVFNKIKLIRKNKKKQASVIDKAAKQMAVATKIGGIKPMGYIKAAVNPRSQKALAENVTAAIGGLIRTSIINSVK